jgi:hypothetical protein
MSTSPKKLVEAPWTVSKTPVEKTIKMFAPTFLQLIVVFYILDVFVFMWANAALFASWRANAEAQKAKDTLIDIHTIAREFIPFFIYGIATYVSVKKFGRTAKALSGPIVVILLAAIAQLIAKYANKYACTTDNSVGCEFQLWYSNRIDDFLGDDDDTSQFILNITAVAFGYLAAA